MRQQSVRLKFEEMRVLSQAQVSTSMRYGGVFVLSPMRPPSLTSIQAAASGKLALVPDVVFGPPLAARVTREHGRLACKEALAIQLSLSDDKKQACLAINRRSQLRPSSIITSSMPSFSSLHRGGPWRAAGEQKANALQNR